MTTEAHEHRIIEISRKAAWEMGAEFRYTPREDSAGPDSLRGDTFIEPKARKRRMQLIALWLMAVATANGAAMLAFHAPSGMVAVSFVAMGACFALLVSFEWMRVWPIYTIKSHIEFRLIEAGYRIYMENGQLHIDGP